MKSDLTRRIERRDMQDWEQQYRFLLGPIGKTPDCTCDWEVVVNYSGEVLHEYRTRLDEECPDHD